MAELNTNQERRKIIKPLIVALICAVLIVFAISDARDNSSASLSQAFSQTPEPSPSLIQAQISSQVKVKAPIKTKTPTPRPTATRPTTPVPTLLRTATPSAKTPTPPAVSCAGNFSAEFLCLLNQYRAANGRNPLSYSSSLNQAAFSHSMWMNNTGIFSHTGENGSSYADRCAAAGTTCYAENIAGGVTSAAQLFQLWKNSSVHNTIMLGPYSALGLGLAGSYVTADFR